MTYQDYKTYFKKEISEKYTDSESSILFDIFVQHLMDWNQFALRKAMTEKVENKQSKELQNIIDELKTGKPYQQILGETEFYGLKFFVDEHVLIPRPETEELLELAIEKIKAGSRKSEAFKILDIGTGSGIIPIVLKKHFPETEVSAIDYSENALKMAQRNAEFHQVEINFIHQDYLKANLIEVYDVIISNPPYIGMEEEDEIADSVKEFEPKMALFSPTSNALIFYEKIAEDCKNHLAKNGFVFLEINQKLGNETLELFTDVLSEVELMKDLSGNERIVWGRF
ncbi:MULTISPECIES: peptide chain release factor N(5)-glutamine methyltransferase [unclassified Kaistella]|uniref:peptide chain release factor N(5)-glutamine methyltransferase n=1 Tax=unclassified Kaistella TaxID=2762626 RepID=UPI0027353C0B|nr:MULTISPECIES: peptide chain release factor N(5)-glutamine methyltransferase [unclassified Kaistella]MDP2454785.1 peptide chain release factor N(5)-glutamine methyltransferase [Kaistella sp. SH11-4b]MDP2457522.1 peptide chain release factor N(5)-glutamine methyltransferase [Kaistella sp. SH40-3]MDP2460282.1 peptide chain release factor N(5)-glutamine methyltransferase [Kaistella sp. SH19-2b]